jgi:tungstate transport system substrate-binding protein
MLACESSRPALRQAPTTTVGNSGLRAAHLPQYEREAGVRVDVLPVGSGRALKLLQQGDAAIAITHDPVAEAAALEAGSITGYRKIMFNDFIIVGPAHDPSTVASAAGAAGAFARIADGGAPFVSRGDSSGTHAREQQLWALAGRRPAPDRLLETGQGMGGTLRVASERGAYTLTDRATFEQFKADLRLALVFEGGADLLNTYAVFVRSGSSGAERDAAEALADWLADGAGRQLIADFRIDGRTVFHAWPAGASRARPADRPQPEPATNAR